MLCGKTYSGGPDKIRIHMDPTVKPREVTPCKPLPEWRERHRIVLAEMRKRALIDAARKQKAIDVDEQREERRAAAGAGPASVAAAAQMFNLKNVEDVTSAWLKVVVKKALPLDIFDDSAFREAIATTARCGPKLTTGAKGDVHLPRRKCITTKELPEYDTALDLRIKDRIAGVLKTCNATLVSDGWTSTSNRPIINALATTPVGSYFIKAVDTSGKTKDAKYISDFMIEVIDDFGPADVTAVCMDGACQSAFQFIERAHPHPACAVLYLSDAFHRQLHEECLRGRGLGHHQGARPRLTPLGRGFVRRHIFGRVGSGEVRGQSSHAAGCLPRDCAGVRRQTSRSGARSSSSMRKRASPRSS